MNDDLQNDYITITRDEYNKMLDRIHFLNCLEAVGVDNWNGYGDAWEMYEEEKNEIEDDE